MTDTDRVASTLAGIRGLIAARDDLAARIDWAKPDDVSEFNAAQDKLAARVPVLLAAIEPVLKEHQPVNRGEGLEPICGTCHKGFWPCRTYRAITTVLTGEPARAALAGEDKERA